MKLPLNRHFVGNFIQQLYPYGKKVSAYINQCLWPHQCLGCNQLIDLNQHFCSSCSLNVMSLPFYFHCNHHKKQYVDGISSCFRYKKPIAHMIHSLKYLANSYSINFASQHLAKRISLILPVDMIVPVPMSLKRLRLRGINAAGELAKSISTKSDISCDISMLYRMGNPVPQVGLARDKRLTNSIGTIAIHPSSVDQIKEKRIAVIDDVITTGATINECAKVLKRAGASHVYALTLANA